MARLSSSTSSGPERREPESGGLFGFLVRGEAADATSDSAWLQAMLDFEAALARAEAAAGLVPVESAAAIGRACVAGRFDVDRIGREATATANPAVPFVRALTDEVARESGDEAAGFVHRGATSQDVMDTAAMLVARRSMRWLLADLDAAADVAAELARSHRAALMLARTLLQPAVPTTFGAVAAGWLAGLERAGHLVAEADRALTLQFGGAAGTLASLGDRGVDVLERLATELDLCPPDVPWHTERTRIAELAAALAASAGACAKVALDIVLLCQSEIGELREAGPGRGGSSTMPQKRNPVAAVSARAAAGRAPGLASTMFAAMPQELQRGAGTWQAEWQTLSDLLRAAGSAAAWLRDSLEHLEVDAARMRSNLDAAGGFPLAEHVTAALAASAGRVVAHSLVEDAARRASESGMTFREALEADRRITAAIRFDGVAGAGAAGPGAVAALLEPAGYLGSTDAFVERALAAHARRRRE